MLCEFEKNKIIGCIKNYIPLITEGCKDEFEIYGLDSITAISLIVDIEEMYGFEFDDEDLIFSKINTLDKLFGVIEKYIK